MPPVEASVHRLSVEDVYRMVDAGILRDEDKVELIDGVLVDMNPPGADHSACVAWLNEHFAGSIGDLQVRVQDLLLVEGGFVMPDLMVVETPPRGQHPASARLVVEVAVTTHRHDRAKARRYAAAGVVEYWIADLPGRELIVHSAPGRAGFGHIEVHHDGDTAATPVGAPPVEVAELLGPAA